MIVLSLIIVFALIVGKSIEFTSEIYNRNIIPKALLILFLTVFFPFILPFASAVLIFSLDSVGHFLGWKKGEYFFEKLISFSLYGTIELFIVALLIKFSGGTWEHSTKSGDRDYRYKWNEYYPYVDDLTKKMATYVLALPSLAIICFIIYKLWIYYLQKK
ncbi:MULTISPECIES: hypothetical protein [Leptospira]|uniref:hypothetical protein n=1 Tax=Leptospira TaxID=171 RepID=UPI000565BB26|nr:MULTISPECIES: hypothetical protein [Leptospira]MDL5247514.1 hypothetical protein [Leptospira weilii]